MFPRIRTRRQGYFYEDEYKGANPGDLFAVTSCSDCFGSSSAKPLPSEKEIRDQVRRDAKKKELEQKAKEREERQKRREAAKASLLRRRNEEKPIPLSSAEASWDNRE
ncbi:hypothetical protein OS493_001207 [Desmophyllum pertusum]|uniref:Uncharacterized protein n=1 Tax=Desmophyllum pertusum TaxID=174260 RepID=A0A9W9ZVA5_9CNID|nr:hypothetical protein OS493_001207 [Desmophyllum pertusum]